VSGHASVEVGEGTNPHVDVLLQQGVALRGAVVIDGAVPADTLPVRVSLRTDPVIPGLADTPAVTPSADGAFVLPPVPAGDYLVQVLPLMSMPAAAPSAPPPAVPGPQWAAATTMHAVPAGLQGMYVKAIEMGGVDVLNGRLRVGRGRIETPLRIVIGTRAGEITGVAVDGSRRGAGHVTVLLAPEASRRHRYDLYRTAVTDAAGRFRISGVPPGDYGVFAWEDVETWSWLDPQFMRNYEGRGLPLQVTEAMRSSVEIPVLP
jgi:hypothetical protein